MTRHTPLRIRYMSDLHLEFSDYRPDPVDADVVVLAGDIDSGTSGLEWAARQFRDTPVIYVAGNHEYYDQDMLILRKELAEAAGRLGIHFLDNQAVVIGQVRFIGSTLWSDFNIGGDRSFSMDVARELVNDYYFVTHGSRLLTPEDTLSHHQLSRAYLDQQLRIPFEGKTVVVTHHAPSLQSLSHDSQQSFTAAAYVSNLEEIARKADIWIHGHIHERLDYRIGKCRILCNPRGYQDDIHRQSTGFDGNITYCF
ncbi:MAG: metallophosphoesterase [Nitrospira sp.]|nr:metallophosphoesterase [Nitrospira sp.]